MWNIPVSCRSRTAISAISWLQPNQWHIWIAETFSFSYMLLNLALAFQVKTIHIPKLAVGENEVMRAFKKHHNYISSVWRAAAGGRSRSNRLAMPLPRLWNWNWLKKIAKRIIQFQNSEFLLEISGKRRCSAIRPGADPVSAPSNDNNYILMFLNCAYPGAAHSGGLPIRQELSNRPPYCIFGKRNNGAFQICHKIWHCQLKIYIYGAEKILFRNSALARFQTPSVGACSSGSIAPGFFLRTVLESHESGLSFLHSMFGFYLYGWRRYWAANANTWKF